MNITTKTPEAASDKTTWMKGVTKKSYPSFKENEKGGKKADVVIVGGGITGIVSAYLLAKAGKRVILLEKDIVGGGVTSYTTAFLTQSIDTIATDLIKAQGVKRASEIIASHGSATDLVERIIKEEKIDCDFSRCSNYIYVNDTKDLPDLVKESEASETLGLVAPIVKDGWSLGFKNGGYMDIQGQAKFQPLKFVYALAEKAEKLGVQTYEHSEVLRLEGPESTGPQRVVTSTGTIEADYVIIATYKPFDNPRSLYFKRATYVSYVVELAVKNMDLKEGVYEDTENLYHYMRIDKAASGKAHEYRVVLGGEDHRKDVHVSPVRNFNALMEYADTIIPVANRTLLDKWIGLMLEPMDGLPSIGRIDDRNVFYTLAFSGNGMTYSSIAAMIFTDEIMGKKNAWAEIYSPKRHSTMKATLINAHHYVFEFFQGAMKNLFTQSKKARD